MCHDPWGQRLYYHRLHYVHRLTAAAKQELQNKQKKGRQVSSIFSLCENNETDALHHMHTHSLGIPAIYERLSSFPLQSAHSVTPVTLARLWQSRDLPPSSDCSILAARLPQWERNLPTAPLQPGGSSSATGAREAEREGEERREGVSSTPLLCCDHTSPARERVSSSHITQEVCCSTLHLLSLYLMYQRRGAVEIWC